MVIPNISSDQKTDITFTIKRDDLSKTKNILENKNIKYQNITYNNKV